MRSSLPAPPSRRLPLSALVFAVAVLYFAREVLIPLALALLFSFLLAPLVRRLERWHFRRAPAVLSVTLLFFCVFGLIGWATSLQVMDLAARIPGYQDNVQRKIAALQHPGGALQDAARTIQDIEKKAAAPETPANPTPRDAEAGDPQRAARTAAAAAAPEEKPPAPVRIIEPPASPPQFLRNYLGPLLGPLGTAGIVIVFTIFMLLQREDLRDRVLHLAGPERLPLTTQAVDEAGSRVSKYLVAQVCVNAGFGVAVTLGLFFIHVPNFMLWGMLAGVCRFVPYVGPLIGAAGPMALSLAAFDTWRPVALVFGLFVVLELTIANAVEPFLYGASTGISPAAVIVAATFWTWLWGGVGLLLSTPLTVCIVVLGRYLPQLEFLHTLLGDEPVMPPDARLYQRLLALDQEEVSDLVDAYFEKHTPIEFYDEVLIPALNQAQIDTRMGHLGEDRQQFVRQTVHDIVSDLSERPPAAFPALTAVEEAADAAQKTDDTAARALDAAPAPPVRPTRVLILPVKTDADETAGAMLAHVLALAGIGAEAVSSKMLVNEILADIGERRIGMVCISAVRPFAVMHARFLAKRLRVRFPQLKVMIGLWDSKKKAASVERKPEDSAADWIVSTLAEAVHQTRQSDPCLPVLTATAVEAEEVTAETRQKPHDLVAR